MKKFLLTTTTLAMIGGAGFAQSVSDQVIAALQAEGYQRIEVENTPTRVKVEAIRNRSKLEVVYDAATGAILSQSNDGIDDDDDLAPGVFVSMDDDDEDDNDDDNDDDDEDDDNDDDDSDDNDDDSDD